jgi:hypothetical protein
VVDRVLGLDPEHRLERVDLVHRVGRVDPEHRVGGVSSLDRVGRLGGFRFLGWLGGQCRVGPVRIVALVCPGVAVGGRHRARPR